MQQLVEMMQNPQWNELAIKYDVRSVSTDEQRIIKPRYTGA